MKHIKIVFLVVYLSVILLPMVSAAPIVPDGYASEGIDFEDPWVYTIKETNGNVSHPITYATVGLEVGGKIEVKFLGFYEYFNLWTMINYGKVPYFNVTFRYKDGTINSTVANISNIDLAYGLTINIGSFIPGIYTKNNWTANDKQVIDESNSSGWYNGSLNIESNFGKHTYEYKQNLKNSNQNTTMIIDEKTGILQAFTSEFGKYHLKCELEGYVIPGYSPFLLIAVSIGIIGYILKRKTH